MTNPPVARVRREAKQFAEAKRIGQAGHLSGKLVLLVG
jgi:hypothetical protein